jgi:purine-binding chemotaxis protein CheW
MPVVDLGALLGARLPPQPARFLSLRLEGRGVILAVEGVVGLRELAPEARSNLPPLLSSASPEVIGRLEDLDAELVVVLRAGRLVPDEAWSLLDGSGSE